MPSLRTRVQYDRTALATVNDLVEVAQDAAAAALVAAATAQDGVDAITAPPLVVSTNTALSPLDVTVLVDTTGGTVTISLSNASGYYTPVTIKKAGGANAVNVVPTGADTLNGGAGPVSLTLTGESAVFVADQISAWFG